MNELFASWYSGNFRAESQTYEVPSVPGLPKNIGDAAIKFGGGLAINMFFGNY